MTICVIESNSLKKWSRMLLCTFLELWLILNIWVLFQVDLKPLREATIAVPTPKISEKRKAEEADASKDLKKVSIVKIYINRITILSFDRMTRIDIIVIIIIISLQINFLISTYLLRAAHCLNYNQILTIPIYIYITPK